MQKYMDLHESSILVVDYITICISSNVSEQFNDSHVEVTVRASTLYELPPEKYVHALDYCQSSTPTLGRIAYTDSENSQLKNHF